MILYHDIPRSKGVENALKRARQMVELQWTPVKPCPAGVSIITPEGKKYIDCFHHAWKPQTGVNYSSVRQHEKFVGFNVSHETYMTALANPRSVMYTKPQHGAGLRMFSYYGIVCSAFVSYVCGLPLRQPCSYWPHDPRVCVVDTADLNGLQLCDIVLDPTKHIAIITDIERDVDGNVHAITVSESTLPVVRATRFTAEEFRGYWLEDGYSVFRFDGLDAVAYKPSPYVHLEGDPYLPVPAVNRSLLPDFGNKANYMLGEAVELDVLEEGWTEVCVTGAEVHTLPMEDGKAAFMPRTPGFYTACCADGERVSEPVEFCVTTIDVGLDQTVYGTKDTMQVSFSLKAEGDEPVGWIVQNMTWGYRGGGVFTEEEKQTGRFTVRHIGKPPIRPELEPGAYQIFVLAKNKYGTYKSDFVDFCVK